MVIIQGQIEKLGISTSVRQRDDTGRKENLDWYLKGIKSRELKTEFWKFSRIKGVYCHSHRYC